MHRLFLPFLAFVCLLSETLSAANLIALPRDGSNGTTGYIYSAEPFTQIGTFATDQTAFEAIWHPTSPKFYVFSRSLNKSITVFNGTSPFAERSSINLPNITGARLSPDARRLYVLSGSLRIFDTFNDQEVIGLNTGGRPIDVDFSLDSTRAYVLNDNGTVVAIDTTTSQVISTLALTNNPNSLMVGPTGFIYVTSSSRIVEIDGRGTLAVIGNEIPTTGVNCTRIQFTPDGSRFVTACASGATSILYSVETISRNLQTITFGSNVDRVRVISNTTALLYVPTSNVVFRAGLVPPLTTPIQLEVGGLGAVSGGRSLAISDQIPTAAYLFLDGPNSISRVSLGTNTVSSTLTQPNFIGNLVFTGPVSTSLPFSLIAITPSQTVLASQAGRPLVIRALDNLSRPVNGVTISFVTDNSQLQLSSSAVTTNKDGFALVGFVAPQTTGTYNVSASNSGSQGQTFTINVTGGSGGGGGGGENPTNPAIQIVSGNGQLMFGQLFAPELLRVRVRDGSGNPAVNATVTWQVQSGTGRVVNAQSSTDNQGIATNQFGSELFYDDALETFRTSVVRATVSNGSVDFFLVSYPEVGPPPRLLPVNPPAINLISPPEGSTIRIQAGAPLTGAIRATIFSGTLAGFGAPIPNVGFYTPTSFAAADAVAATCTSTSLSNGQGQVSCDLVGGSRLGSGPIQVCLGNCQNPGRLYNFNVEVTPGPPAIFVKRQGDNQSGGPGTLTPLALRAALTDQFGNRLPGVTVRVEVIQGEAIPEQVFNTTTNEGEFSFLVRFGSSPGEVKIRTSAGDASTIWTLTNNVTVGNFVKVSGDNQTSVLSRPFTSPLTVQLNDAQGRPIAGAAVAFTISNGSATLSAATATTNAQGQASISVTAGAVAGPVTVTATSINRSVVFALTVLPPGPTITSVSNAASFAPGLTPCGLATIFGSNIAPTLNGSVSGNSFVGPYPFTLQNVRVEVGSRQAPIVSVSNIGGREQVTIQTPCELQASPATPVRVFVGDGSSTFTTSVAQVQPGVFETTDSANRKIGVIIKANGTYMSLENPVDRGERVIGFFTGLGQLLVPTVTNIPGAYNNSSNVAAQIIIGVNNEGVPVQSVTMAPGLVGIYIVVFDIPAETTPGANRPYGTAAIGADSLVAGGNPSLIHVR